MPVRFWLFVIGLVFALGACAHHREERAGTGEESAEAQAIKKRAMGDLNCSEEIKVEVIQEGNMMRPWTFQASGCGQRATYLTRAGMIIRN